MVDFFKPVGSDQVSLCLCASRRYVLSVVHARKLACQCGYVFPAKAEQNERKRPIETRQTDSVRKAAKRACATHEETLKRHAQNKQHMASLRQCETREKTCNRQAQSKEHMASIRQCETREDRLKRRTQNKQHMASVRQCETRGKTCNRQAQSKEHMASIRQCETREDRLKRQAQNKEHMASVRASETPDQTLHSNKQSMSSTRKRNVSIECAVSAFHSKVKFGPDYVCTCCHRMMYRKSVIPCNKAKYTKVSADVIQKVFSSNLSCISFDGKQWVCRTCDRTLKRGTMPLQAKANGLQLCQVPPELSGLNALELRLICLRVPFMKMVALPTGKQRSIHGPAVNVPSKVDTISEVLPRLPSQTEMVPLKLKRKVAYQGKWHINHMYDYVTPQKPLDALRFLKAQNPLYCDIEINQQWLEEADDELGMCLVEQSDESMDTESDQPETESEPMECSGDELSLALQKLKKLALQNGFTIFDVPYDGNCMFSAISHQLQTSVVCSVDSSELRQMVASHMEANAALYRGFMCQPVATDDEYNADTEPPTAEDEYINSVSDPELQTQLRWAKYLRRLRQDAWGDHINMQAIADMLSVKINVLSSDHPVASATPSNATCEMSVGLIKQYHYVGRVILVLKGLHRMPKPFRSEYCSKH